MIVLFIKSAVLKMSIKSEFKVKVIVTVNPTFSKYMLDPVIIALDEGLRLVSVVHVWFVFKNAANGEKHIMEGQG